MMSASCPRLMLLLLFAVPHEVWGVGQSCNSTEVRQCYSNILDSVVGELSQEKPAPSLHEILCEKYGTTSQCEADTEPCLASFPALADVERLYSTIRQEACGDSNFTLLRSLRPTAQCTPLPIIVSCIENRQLLFYNSTEDTKVDCNELGTGLHSCLSALDEKCPKHRRRAAYAKKTLATMMEIRGCDAGDGVKTQHGTADVQEGSDDEKCSYRQLRRCNEKQINDIRTRMNKLRARNLLPHDSFSVGLCRKTRKSCHQHSTVEACAAQEQEAIRRLEEAMDEAQALLCKDDRALVKNLLLSYQWWNIQHFTKCSSNIQVNSITEFLYNRPRVYSECRLLKSRLFRCLNESYLAAYEAVPKPDVEGARKVLAIFLDRMTCVDGAEPLLLTDRTSRRDVTGDADYPGEEVGGNSTEDISSAIPVISDVESDASTPAIRMSALASFVLLIMVPARYLTQS